MTERYYIIDCHPFFKDNDKSMCGYNKSEYFRNSLLR